MVKEQLGSQPNDWAVASELSITDPQPPCTALRALPLCTRIAIGVSIFARNPTTTSLDRSAQA